MVRSVSCECFKENKSRNVIFIDSTGKQRFHNVKQMKHEEDVSPALEELLARLEERASESGFTVVDKDKKRSGNCMFVSLSDQLELVEEDNIKCPPEELRQSIVQNLRDHPRRVS